MDHGTEQITRARHRCYCLSDVFCKTTAEPYGMGSGHRAQAAASGNLERRMAGTGKHRCNTHARRRGCFRESKAPRT